MIRCTPVRRRLLSLALAVDFLAGFPTRLAAQGNEIPPEKKPPVAVAQPEETRPEEPGGEEKAPLSKKQGATLRGRILRSDRRTPSPAAVLHAIAPDGTVYTASPSDHRGNYALPGLPPETYRLAVVLEEGVYSMENPIGISSANEFRVDLAAVPAESASGRIPGIATEPRGFIYILQGKKGGGTTFWRGPKGITVLVVSAAAAALILSQGNEEDKPVSPSAP